MDNIKPESTLSVFMYIYPVVSELLLPILLRSLGDQWWRYAEIFIMSSTSRCRFSSIHDIRYGDDLRLFDWNCTSSMCVSYCFLHGYRLLVAVLWCFVLFPTWTQVISSWCFMFHTVSYVDRDIYLVIRCLVVPIHGYEQIQCYEFRYTLIQTVSISLSR